MKYLPFIYKNILRNKRRTFLIFISLSFSLFLYVFLFTVLSSMNKVMYRPSIMNNIFAGSTAYDIKHNDFPESYIDKIKTISHVVDVNPCLQIFTYFEKSTKVISIFGIIPDKLHEVFDITRIDGLDTDGLFKGKTTALVGYQLMEEYNWKIGDKIILKSGAYQEEIPFTIKGVVHGLSNAPSIIYLNLRYLQNILNNQGRVSFIYIKADDQSFIPEIIRKVEAMFHNHPVEVFAFTQKSFNDSIVDKIKAILIAFWFIGWITIISTFLLVANCIAISVRERTTEIGVMRVLGFSRSRILVLVLTESVGVALAGGMAGALLAYILPTIYHITIPATVPLHVGPDASLVVYGFLISILIGFFGGILPALNSVLMKPSESIGGVG
jgi:putative ABC transport system permease protein